MSTLKEATSIVTGLMAQLQEADPDACQWAIHIGLCPTPTDAGEVGLEPDEAFGKVSVFIVPVPIKGDDRSSYETIRGTVAMGSLTLNGEPVTGSRLIDVVRLGEIPSLAIEASGMPEGDYSIDMYVDDEGLLLGQAPNPIATTLADQIIVGEALLVLSNEHTGESVGMNQWMFKGLYSALAEYMMEQNGLSGHYTNGDDL